MLLGGLAFLATFIATRSYGFLVPGGILTGFGAALVAQDLGLVDDIGLFGLGGGFLLIPALQLATRMPRDGGWWWPLIPGGILVLLGRDRAPAGGDGRPHPPGRPDHRGTRVPAQCEPAGADPAGRVR